ncbi:MAG: sugar phosphate nucleotidyltransferase, partial [Anaerolineaceae bacterium]
IFPKPMMPIGDKAILEILLSQMKHHGVDEVILTVGHLAGLMRAFFQDGTAFGLKIDYSYEEQPLGTAGPLAKIDGLTETFLVANGDILTTLDIADLIRFHHAQKDALITIATHERKVNIDLGVVEMNGDHTVKGYIEKPNLDYLVSMGLYVFEPSVIEYIPQDEYLDFPDLVIKLIAAGKKVSAYPFNGYWQDLGRQDDYEQANMDFEMMRSQFLPEG